MAGPRSVSRRQLARSGLAGALIGTVWASGLRAMSLPDAPTLSLIGADGVQIALVDTTEVRALVLLGVPPDRLLDRVPSLLTLHRQRIDVVIGGDQAVEAISRASLPGAPQALIVEASTDAYPVPGASRRTVIRQSVAISLGHQAEATLRLCPRRQWLATGEDSSPLTLWALELRHRGARLLLAPTAEAAVAVGRPRPTVLITPGDDPRLAVEKLMPGAVALNAEATAAAPLSAGTLVRVFPDEIARLELREAGVRLPPWAEQADSASG